MRNCLGFIVVASMFLLQAAAYAAEPVSSPATVILKVDQEILLADIGGAVLNVANIDAAQKPKAHINIITGGGCSPSAMAQGCLGGPASMQAYTLTTGEELVFMNLKIVAEAVSFSEAKLSITKFPEEPLCDSCDAMKAK